MSQLRLRNSLFCARQSAREAGAGDWAAGKDVDLEGIAGAVSTELRMETIATESERKQLGYILARTSRGGPAVSIKPSNVAREISRTVYVTALFGIFHETAASSPDVVRVISGLTGILFASFQATRATVGYSDAAVLHKAWRLSAGRSPRTVAMEELLACRQEIANGYKAPKCASENEIMDAVRNLCGLKAIVERNGDYELKERIVFFEDGSIKS